MADEKRIERRVREACADMVRKAFPYTKGDARRNLNLLADRMEAECPGVGREQRAEPVAIEILERLFERHRHQHPAPGYGESCNVCIAIEEWNHCI